MITRPTRFTDKKLYILNKGVTLSFKAADALLIVPSICSAAKNEDYTDQLYTNKQWKALTETLKRDNTGADDSQMKIL